MSELPYRPSRQRFYQDLSQCLFDFVVQLLPTPEELAVKEDVRKLLERLIRTIEPQSRLLSFGSTANGFSLRNSDMDLCCLIDSEERLSASDLVTMLGDLLERETKFTVKPLPHARIPIVKLSLAPSPGLPLGIACDIGFENRLALENTRLLMCYAMIDPTRVRTMVLFLKVWSKRRKINSPYQGTLSSYGFVLLVIYFLVHVKNPPVLPNLQQMPPLRKTSPDEFTVNGHNTWFFDDIDIIRQRWQSANTETVAELLVDFFRYYSRDFAYNTGVASIRAGLLRKESKGWQNHLTGPRYHDARERNRFCIEDPFETDFNVARCVTKDGLYLIRGELMRASRILATRPERAIVALAQLCEERKETPVPAPVPTFTPSGASKPVRISPASSSDTSATITPEGATTSTTTTTTTPDIQMPAAPTPRTASIPPQTPYTVGSSPGPVAVTGLSPKPRAFVPSGLGNETSTSSSSSSSSAAAATAAPTPAATIGVPRHSPPEHMASKRLLLPTSGPDGDIQIDCDAIDAGLAIATASTEAREPERRHAPGSETASESSGASELAEEDADEIDLRSVHSLDVRVLESPVDSSPAATANGLLQLQQLQQQEGERGRGRLVLPSYGGHHYYHHANSGYGGTGGHGGGGLLPPQAMPPFESTRRSLSGPPSRAQNRLSWPLPLNLVNPLPSPAAVAAASASASTSFASNSGSSNSGRDVFYETRRPQQQQSAYPVSPLPSPSHQHRALHSHQAGPMPMSYPSPVHTPTPMPSSVFSRSGNSAQRHRNTASTATVKPPRMRSRGPVDAAESSGGEFGGGGGGGSRSSSRLSMTRPISPAAGVGEPYYRPSSSLSIDKRMIPLPPSPMPPPSPGMNAAFVSAKMAGLNSSSSPSSGVHYQQQQQLHSPHHLAHHHHYHNLSQQQHHHLLIPHRRDTTGSTGSASPTASMYGSSSTTSESSVSASPPAPLSPAIKAGTSSPPLSLPLAPASHSRESVGVGGCGKIEVGQQVQQEQLRLRDGILGR